MAEIEENRRRAAEAQAAKNNAQEAAPDDGNQPSTAPEITAKTVSKAPAGTEDRPAETIASFLPAIGSIEALAEARFKTAVLVPEEAAISKMPLITDEDIPPEFLTSFLDGQVTDEEQPAIGMAADDSLAINWDDLLRDAPGLAAAYGGFAETAMPEPANLDGLPLEEISLEPGWFEGATAFEDTLTMVDEAEQPANPGGPETSPDLATLLQSLDAEQAEAVQPILSTITRLAGEIQELPDTDGDEAAETEKLVKEQTLEEWCARLFDNLGIKADNETIRHFARLMTGQETTKTATGREPMPAVTADKGTHERKAADTLAAFSRLASDVKQKLHLLLWIGRHVLRVAANLVRGPELAISEPSL